MTAIEILPCEVVEDTTALAVRANVTAEWLADHILPRNPVLWPEAVRRIQNGWRYKMSDCQLWRGRYWSKDLPTISPESWLKWLHS